MRTKGTTGVGMKIMFLRALFYIFVCMFNGGRRLKVKLEMKKIHLMEKLPSIVPKGIR